MSKEDFDIFWKTHLVTSSQGCNMPEETVLYWHTAKEETSNFPWTRRIGTSTLHATAAAVRDLLTQVRVATRKNCVAATLIQNYSPCFKCVEDVLKTIALAKEKRIKFEISLAFVALNGIRRPSWIWRGMETATHRVTINESNYNSFALRQLHEAGVNLCTFNPDTWKFLYTFLGNGVPVKNHGKYLAGKFQSVESRFEEDKFMEADLKQVLKGLTMISPSIGVSNSILTIEWCKPCLTGEKISEYKVVCKKVTVKNRDEDDRSWRIQQTVDTIGVKANVPADLTSFHITDLELDTFYDVTVEAMVKSLSSCTGRKLFRTGNKAPIPSLQTPTMTRKLSNTTRPRTSSSSTFNKAAASASAVRLNRSNSFQSANESAHQASCDLSPTLETPSEKVTTKMFTSGAERNRISVGDLDQKTASSSFSRGLYRSSSLCNPTVDRPAASGDSYIRKTSETGKPTNSVRKGSTSTSGSSIVSTAL